MIESITILGGRGKDGTPEPVDRIDLRMGDVVSVVGPTGSGKTTLINDLELFAHATHRRGGRCSSTAGVRRPSTATTRRCNPIALITQHTSFLSDLPVGEFLTTHCADPEQ